MRKRSICVLACCGVVVSAGCARRVPEPSGVAPGVPHISWVIMSGDRDNPDQDFVCQSDPRNDCVVPASRPDAQVFSDVHFYFHGAGPDTKYTGTIQVGFFRDANDSHAVQTNITVKKNESITNQSVTNIVTATPGTYVMKIELTATSAQTGQSQPIREEVPIVVR